MNEKKVYEMLNKEYEYALKKFSENINDFYWRGRKHALELILKILKEGEFN